MTLLPSPPAAEGAGRRRFDRRGRRRRRRGAVRRASAERQSERRDDHGEPLGRAGVGLVCARFRIPSLAVRSSSRSFLAGSAPLSTTWIGPVDPRLLPAQPTPRRSERVRGGWRSAGRAGHRGVLLVEHAERVRLPGQARSSSRSGSPDDLRLFAHYAKATVRRASHDLLDDLGGTDDLRPGGDAAPHRSRAAWCTPRTARPRRRSPTNSR